MNKVFQVTRGTKKRVKQRETYLLLEEETFELLA